MQTSDKITPPRPLLPTPLSFPLRAIPSFVHNKALVTMLNRIFHDELKEGELDFLHNKTVNINIEDAGINYRFTLDNNKLIASNKKQTADLNLKGTIYDYLLLASRQEDTDALFFSRRLHMQGDTELGLHVKNFLDGLDMETHKFSAYIETVLKKSLPLYEKLFS